jgi:hypothetical protein
MTQSPAPDKRRRNARYNDRMSMTTLTRSYPRPPRFQVKDKPVGFRLDDRKIALLRALAQHRFLTSEQLASIDGGSHQKIQRILRTMFD